MSWALLLFVYHMMSGESRDRQLACKIQRQCSIVVCDVCACLSFLCRVQTRVAIVSLVGGLFKIFCGIVASGTRNTWYEAVCQIDASS